METRQDRPLRIAQLVRSLHFGGTEVQVVELLRGLMRRHHVQLGVLDEAGPLLESVWKLGVIPRAFPLKGSFARPNTLWQIARLANWLRQTRADLIHAQDFYSALIAVPAAKLAGVKVVVGRLDLAHWHGKARRAVLREMTRAADHVIANAEAIRRQLMDEERISPERISVIHNGLDLPRFDEHQRAGLGSPLPEVPPGAAVVVHVANMNHGVKRQEDLLAAVALARGKGRDLHVFLVGDGPRRPELERLAGRLGLAGAAHFLGRRADVPAVYARASFGVLCSTAEGLSNAVMEGMAAGLPMVVTRAGGNAELVLDGERGLVVEPRQPARLCDAFCQLLDQGEGARRMGAAARRFVERELTLERLIASHEALYEELLCAPARAGAPMPASAAP